MKPRIFFQCFVTFTIFHPVLTIDVSLMTADAVDWILNTFGDYIQPLSSPGDQEILEEIMMDTIQISKKYGYEGEYHNVTTQDEFILELHRIPHGKKNKTVGNPVLIYHGNGAMSEFYVSNGENSLAFYLADNGYDVWLGNARGTPRSWSKKYSRRQKEFWDFSWEDIADYDIPDTVDYILKKSGKSKLVLMGHSMENIAGFAFLAAHTDYHNKIAGFVAMSPVVLINYTPSIFQQLLPFRNIFTAGAKLLGVRHFMVFPKKLLILGQHLCPVKNTFICGYGMDLFGGYDSYLRNNTRNYLYVTRGTATSSTKPFIHYCQVYDKRAMYRFDYGPKKNLIKYQSSSPPIYDLKQIKVPVVLMYGANDLVADAIDNTLLARDLPNLMDVKIIDFPLFNHLDFAYAVNPEEFYYKDLLDYIKRMFK